MREQKITLNQSQLFHLQAPTLETRITRFYQLTQNSSTAIQYILATKVRQQLGAQEFKGFLKDLVRHLFLHTKATRTMKRFFHYFADYFMAPEFRAAIEVISSPQLYGKGFVPCPCPFIPCPSQ